MNYFISPKFFETLFLITVACVVVLLVRSFDSKIIKTKGDKLEKLKSIKIVIEIFKFSLLIMIVYEVLIVNGVNVSNLVKNLGIAGIVVGFALNDLLKDLVMGITIMLENYYKLGDNVIYQGEIGKVVGFNIKTTRLFLYKTEETKIICNRNVTEISRASDWIDIDIPIGYDIDVEFARAICRKCARRIERLRYVYSCDFLNTQNFEGSYVLYKLRIHHLVEKQFMVRRNANSVVQDVYKEHKLTFPYGVTVLYDGEKLKDKAHNLPVRSQIYDKHLESRDYEMGKGADTSKTISFDGSPESIEKAMKETERYSGSENLGKKMTQRMRLLSEELLSMVQNIDNIKDGSFHIERNESSYEIDLDAIAFLTKEKKKMFKETKQMTNDDSAMTQMVKSAIDAMLDKINRHKSGEQDIHDAMDDSIISSENNYGWSYNVYKEKEDAEKTYDELMKEDILEQSVLTAFADDIKISMSNNKLRIRVFVKNIEEEE